MGKWIVGILGTVVGGVLLAWALNLFGPDDRKHDDGSATSNIIDDTVVMGQLQYGINLQGNDFDAFGKPAGNEQLCAEMCRSDSKCDAMTYVKSTGRCWMKHGVPATSVNSDMVSAVKLRGGHSTAM